MNTRPCLCASLRYRRVVLKLSGEAFSSELATLDSDQFAEAARSITEVHALGADVLVVVGGGNVFRGAEREKFNLSSSDGDKVGMIATGLNAALLEGGLRAIGTSVEVFSRGPCIGVGTPWERNAVNAALEHGVVILAGGLGVPSMSTDVPAVHAAVELDADAVIMEKHGVDGVYTSDPRLSSDARLLPVVSASNAIEQRLGVMDIVALELARQFGKTIHVVPASDRTAAAGVVRGEDRGSRVTPF